MNEHITSLHCINANGDIQDKVFVIFSKNIPTTMDHRSIPEEWGYGCSESGYMNKDLFFIWFRLFTSVTNINEINMIKLNLSHIMSNSSRSYYTCKHLQTLQNVTYCHRANVKFHAVLLFYLSKATDLCGTDG